MVVEALEVINHMVFSIYKNNNNNYGLQCHALLGTTANITLLFKFSLFLCLFFDAMPCRELLVTVLCYLNSLSLSHVAGNE